MHVLHDEEELARRVATTSSVGTTLGCRMRAASRASSRNIDTNSGSSANCGCSRLIGDRAREADRAEQAPDVDGRHPTGRDLVVQRVPPEDARRRSSGLLHQVNIAERAANRANGEYQAPSLLSLVRLSGATLSNAVHVQRIAIQREQCNRVGVVFELFSKSHLSAG